MWNIIWPQCLLFISLRYPRNLFSYATMLPIDPLQSEQLVELLLNTIPILERHCLNLLSFSHGEYFYSLFKTTINTELLRQLEITVPLLMKASSENPTMVAVYLCYISFCQFFKMCFNLFGIFTMVIERNVWVFVEIFIRSVCCWMVCWTTALESVL